MRRQLLPALAALILAACGAYAPPAPGRSAVEERQTALALQGQPTLPALEAGPTAPPQPTPDLPALLDIAPDDPRSLGRPDAPVLMVEFTDFECPFCASFVQGTRAELIRRFVDAGVLRLVTRDYPVTQIHPSAVAAAVAGRCAAAQGQFWPMYERLFATHDVEWGGYPERDRGTFVELAGELGLDAAAFAACQDDPASEAAVLAEARVAEQLRVNATPSFLINGRLIVGDQSPTAFGRLIQLAAGQQ